MKWTNYPRVTPKPPQEGEGRVISKFAWMPTRTQDNYVVWLQCYYLHQEYCWIYPLRGDNYLGWNTRKILSYK